MTVNFSHLLSKPMQEAERPKAPPQGTYHGRVDRYEFGESKEKKTPYCRFHFKITAPGDDIEPSELEGIELHKKSLRQDFYITEDALFRLREFLESCGVDMEGGRGFNEGIPDCLNAEVLLSLVHKQARDPKDPPYVEIERVTGTARQSR